MLHPTDIPLQATPLLNDTEDDLPTKPTWKQHKVTSASTKLKRTLHLVLSSVLLLRPTQILRLFQRFCYAFVPQLFRTAIWNDKTPPQKEFPTSYLNGLRGCTALKVFTFHYMHAYSDIAFIPWGANERHYYFLELPIIRYFYAGFTSHIFFGVAGYLTSIRLLRLMDNPNPVPQAKVLANISASLFRRAFRLYLPVALITLMTATWLYLGVYEHNRPYLLDHQKYFPGIWNEPKPIQYSTYSEQLRDWSSEMFQLSDFIGENTFYPYHDQHLWSIQSEMRASFHLYLCLLMLAQCKRGIRLIFFPILTLIYFYWNHWEIWVYVLGAWVAQIDIVLSDAQHESKNKLPSSSEEELKKMEDAEQPTRGKFSVTLRCLRRRVLKLRHIALPFSRVVGFMIAFYFLSYPIYGTREYAPGYMTLNLAIPDWMVRKDKFYPNIGTGLFLFLLTRSDPQTSKWRKLLNSNIPQYMGKISFGFYLVHGPVMHLFGYMVPQWLWGASLGLEGGNDATDLQWVAGVICGWVLTLGASLWAADVWAREIEARCVKLVKMLERWCFRAQET